MPLVKPDYAVYGPTTFQDLRDIVDTFYENDEFLKGLIDDIDPTPTVSKAAVALAAGYSHNASYVSTRCVKTGDQVTLECGVINCPASFAAGVYNTLGTVPVGYRIADGKHRMGVGAIFAASAIIPVQYRINQADGSINFYSVTAVASASYIILSPINWDVVAP